MTGFGFREALRALEALPDNTVIGVDPWSRRPVQAGELVCRLVFGSATPDEVGALLVLAGLPIGGGR